MSNYDDKVRAENSAFLFHLKIAGAVVVLGLISFCSLGAKASEEMYNSEEFNISASLQSVRAQHTHLFSRRWGAYGALGYVDDRPYVAGGITFRYSDRFSSSLGVGVMEPNERIGTYGHYDLIPIRFNVSETFAIQWNHKSNNRTFIAVLPRGHAPNKAYDLIEVVWRSRFLR